MFIMAIISRESFVSKLWKDLYAEGYTSSIIRSSNSSVNRFSNQLCHPDIDIDDYDTLATYARNGDNECIKLLCIYSTRLVYKIASGFTTKFTPEWYNIDEDLMQAGFVGLLDTLPRWKPEKGSFRTYSHYFIRLAIIEETRLIDNFIEIKDEDRANLARKLPKLWVECQSEIESPTKTEFAKWLNENGHINKNIRNGRILVKDIDAIEQLMGIGSLNNTIVSSPDEDQLTLFDILEDQTSESPEDRILEEERRARLADLWKDILNNLTEKQRIVFTLYNGLEPLEPSEERLLKNGRITYKILAVILQRRYPEYRWSETSCQELHSRSMQRTKKYVKERGLTIGEFIDND